MTPEAQLLHAALAITRYGHHKHGFFDGSAHDYESPYPYAKAPACATGAIARAAGFMYPSGRAVSDDVVESEAVARLAETITRLRPEFSARTGEAFRTVVDFNDHPNTTAEEVVLIMREAAGMADIQEDDAKVVEFEPIPESTPTPAPAPVTAPAEPVPA